MGPRTCRRRRRAIAAPIILFAQTLDGIVGDKKERSTRCRAEEDGPKAGVNAAEAGAEAGGVGDGDGKALLGLGLGLGLQAGLEGIQREKGRINGDASGCPGLFFTFFPCFVFAWCGFCG